MLHTTINSMSMKCLNRNCKCAFDKACHLGWIPQEALAVYAVVRCHKCKYTFKLLQPISAVHEYYNRLPDVKAKAGETKAITISEITKFRTMLDDPRALAKLYPGKKPGAISIQNHEE